MEMNVCHVEDDDDAIKTVSSSCTLLNSHFEKEYGKENAVTIKYNHIRSFEEFQAKIDKLQIDILVIDLKLGPDLTNLSGLNSLYLIKNKEIIPVIIFSAFTAEIPEDKDLEKLLFTKVPKGGPDPDLLIKTLKHVFGLKYYYKIQKNRIIDEFEKITLETISELMKNDEFLKVDSNLFAIFAASRLTSLLLNSPPNDQKTFPPESIFIFPPLELKTISQSSVMLGDFLNYEDEEKKDSLWMVCSPSCDVIYESERKPKVQNILLLRCYQFPKEIWKYRHLDEKDRNNALDVLFDNRTCKIIKCPLKIFGVDHLFIYFKDYSTVQYDIVIEGFSKGNWKKIATLATPYAESLQHMFVHDISRIGTPDTPNRKAESEWLELFKKQK
jgi:hypothetical protein